MAMIPFGFFHRSMFDWDRPWFRTPIGFNTLDIFDPFDELDHAICRNLMWINRPKFMRPFVVPRVPHKYRVTVDCSGFKPNSIKTEVNGQRLTVTAREENKHDSENYSIKEFRKSYDLPPEAETSKIASFITSNGQLVIEAPIKQQRNNEVEEFFPQLSNDGKQVSFNFSLPKNIDASKVSVTCKDRDIIVKAEDKIEKPDSKSSYSFYKSSTLPENTDFNAIKCSMDNNQLTITAPLLSDFKQNFRQIPIENVRNKSITQ